METVFKVCSCQFQWPVLFGCGAIIRASNGSPLLPNRYPVFPWGKKKKKKMLADTGDGPEPQSYSYGSPGNSLWAHVTCLLPLKFGQMLSRAATGFVLEEEED